MPKRRTPITAAELVAQQKSDPAFIVQRDEFEKRRQAQIAQFKIAESPILLELQQAGFSITSLQELIYLRIPFHEAVPILLKWLPLVQNNGVKETLLRALSVPWAPPAFASWLVKEFKLTDDTTGLKWAIGNALSIVARDADFANLSELVTDQKHDSAREMVAVALGNVKNPAAVDLLIRLLGDEQVAGHAIMALGKLKAEKARSHIEPFLKHSKTWIRKEAAKALKKLDRQIKTTLQKKFRHG